MNQLKLSKETVRSLSPSEAQELAGGLPVSYLSNCLPCYSGRESCYRVRTVCLE